MRGLAVVEALAASDEPLGPTQVAERVGLDKATVSRLLYTLCASGWAEQGRYGAYSLTSKLLRVAGSLAIEPVLQDVARPHLVRLRDETGETAHLGKLELAQVVYVDKVEGTQLIRLVSAIGEVMPLHTTSLGKAALAFMPEAERERLLGTIDFAPRTERSIRARVDLEKDLIATRERGYSVDDRENQDEALCVGAPIVGSDGNVLGMVSVAGPYDRMRRFRDERGDSVCRAARAISDEFNDHRGLSVS